MLPSKRYEPEFVNLDDNNNSQCIAIKLIGTQKTILEIGTSTGYVSKILKEYDNIIYGVEIDVDAGNIARNYCQMMIIGDVETLELEKFLNKNFFDVILCGDIIEHLKNTSVFLQKLKQFLKPDGYLVVSIPNFCHGDVILNILLGDFHYTPQGLLDQTHIHFFGLKNIYEDFSNCGYEIHNLHRVIIDVGSTELKVNEEKIHPKLLEFVKSLPDSNVFQYVFTAHPTSEGIENPINDVDLATITEKFIEESHLELRLAIAELLQIVNQKERANLQLVADLQILKSKLMNCYLSVRIFRKCMKILQQYTPMDTKRGAFLNLITFWGNIYYYDGAKMFLKRAKPLIIPFFLKMLK